MYLMRPGAMKPIIRSTARLRAPGIITHPVSRAIHHAMRATTYAARIAVHRKAHLIAGLLLPPVRPAPPVPQAPPAAAPAVLLPVQAAVAVARRR